MSQANAPSTGVESDRPLGVALLCGLNSLGLAAVTVFALRALANGRPGVAALGVGVVLVTGLLTVGLWNTYTWGWELGVVYYGIAVLLNLVSVATVTGAVGHVVEETLVGLAVSVAALAYLVAARDAFGEN